MRPNEERGLFAGGRDVGRRKRVKPFTPGGARPQPSLWTPTRQGRRRQRQLEAKSRGKIQRREAVYRRGLGLADLLCTELAVVVALGLLGHDQLKPTALALGPLVVLLNKSAGLYDRDEHLLHKTTLDEGPTVFLVAAMSTLLVWLSSNLVVEGDLGRDQGLAFWSLLLGLMLIGRTTTRYVVRRLTSSERCVVVGDRRTTQRIWANLKLTPAIRAELIGRVAIPGSRTGEEGSSVAQSAPPAWIANGEPAKPHHRSDALHVPVLGDLSELEGILEELDCDRVIIASTSSDADTALEAIRATKALGIRVSVLPRLFKVVETSVEFDDVGGLTLLGLRRGGLTRSSALLKRAVDVVGASAALIGLSPVFVVAWLVIQLESPGPAFFRQARIGRKGRTFSMIKFRTMVESADEQKARLLHLNESEGLFKIVDDPRLTRVGRLLRQTHLDELPQLVNVLKGDMSLVGPRPLVPEEDRRVEGFDRIARLDLVPGMTGPWQVKGSALIPLRDMVTLDYLYAANWSLWLDIKILIRTLLSSLARRGL